MNQPSSVLSTYRLQFAPYFQFSDAARLASYLEKLGVSHIYSSPIFEAVDGSTHGYDVTDFSTIRSEIGGENSFVSLNNEMRRHSIGWIQDFVPNHMAMDPRNPYLFDVMENGINSKYAHMFDIDWDHPAFEHGKIGLPVLAKPFTAKNLR